jgi:hypothetical protein
MGSSRAAAGRLLGFLADAQARGVEPALRALDLASLVGKSIDELFLGLADYICPTDGSVDSGVTRDAYTETIVEVAAAGVQSVESLTADQVQAIVGSFITNSIFDRLCSDIGAGVIELPKDAREVASIQDQIKDFIRGAVSDALGTRLPNLSQVSQSDTKSISTAVYEQAFSIMASYGGN